MMDLKLKFGEFFTKNNGKAVEVEDPYNKNQCFDLAFDWVDFLGIPRDSIRHLHAFEIYTKPTDSTVKYFELIPNTSNGKPIVGDVVIFNTTVGKSGHVSIANGSGDLSWFESLDQNWAGKQIAQLVRHDYSAVIGWLRVRQDCSKELESINKELIGIKKERDDFEKKYKAAIKDHADALRIKDKLIKDQGDALSLAGQTATQNQMEIKSIREERDKLKTRNDELELPGGILELLRTENEGLLQRNSDLSNEVSNLKVEFDKSLAQVPWLKFILAKIKG